MRLSVSIGAWSRNPDATLPPEQAKLPAALQALGFSIANVAISDARGGLASALAGLEDQDTLLVHLGGTLTDDGSLETSPSRAVPLREVADTLEAHRRTRTLVFVEAQYDGEPDAMRALEHVKTVAGILKNPDADRATVIAVHPLRGVIPPLAFTDAVLEAARDVLRPDGTALVEDAYSRAREVNPEGFAASGFAFLRGAGPFVLGRGLRSVPAPAATTPTLPDVEEPAAPEPQAPAARVSVEALFAAAALRIGRTSSPEIVIPDPSIQEVAAPAAPAPEPTEPPASDPAPSAPTSRTAYIEPDRPRSPAQSGDWVEATLALDSSARRVVDERIAAAVDAGDFPLVVRLRRERLAELTTLEARVDELFEIGRMQVAKLRDLPEAVLTLEEARGVDPTRADVLEALRRAYARLSRWNEALEVTLALVRLIDNPHERAGLRTAAAMLACEHLGDDDYGLDLLTAALADDPGEEAALGELVRIRRSRGDLVDLEHTLASLAQRLVETGAPARAWDVCQRLAALRRDDMGDAAGAVAALAIAKQLPLTELDSRAVLAEQLLALGDHEGAVGELEAIIEAEPEQVRAHARLFSVHLRQGDHDRAYLSALALEELGDADATAREVLEAYRADWGLRARMSLDDRAWELLRARGSDEVIESVFRATLRAGIAAQLEDRGRHPLLDPARRQSESTTASIVRCFGWAARALGVPCPALYLLDHVAGGIAAVSATEPSTAFDPSVTRGLSSKTLAFLAGRHLTYFRPEYQPLVHFPTVEEAAGLFFAAVGLVAPAVEAPSGLGFLASSTRQRLARHLRAEETRALSEAVGRMEARQAPTDFLAWIRSVELTASRAGLLLAGDLQTALAQVRSEPRGLNGLGVEGRRADLLAFCASRSLATLRASYADTSRSSTRPPTSGSAFVHRDAPAPRQAESARSRAPMLA